MGIEGTSEWDRIGKKMKALNMKIQQSRYQWLRSCNKMWGNWY